jgi:hypothetical protein
MSIRFSLLRVALLLLLIGTGCLVTFQLIGSSVDQNGFVQEPFALIPIGWLFIIVGAIIAAAYLIRTGLNKLSRKVSR